MSGGWRTTLLFAGGSLAGALAVLAAYLGWFQPDEVVRTETLPYVAAPAPAPVQPVAAAPPPQDTVARTGSCPSESIVGAASQQDGRFALEAALASRSHTDPSAFVAVAREAAGEGRMRDAEVALIAACHVAARTSGGASAPVADLKSQLAQQYVTLAASGSSDEAREQLLRRAGTLFSESATAYAAALGKNASKTRMAQQRLAALADPQPRQPLAAPGAGPLVVTAPDAAMQDTSRAGAARSATLAERPPLRTEELSQVDQDMERLYAQVRAVSPDPAGLQRRHQQALARRSACLGDQDCLRNWYAQRRKQLFDEF